MSFPLSLFNTRTRFQRAPAPGLGRPVKAGKALPHNKQFHRYLIENFPFAFECFFFPLTIFKHYWETRVSQTTETWINDKENVWEVNIPCAWTAAHPRGGTYALQASPQACLQGRFNVRCKGLIRGNAQNPFFRNFGLHVYAYKKNPK